MNARHCYRPLTALALGVLCAANGHAQADADAIAKAKANAASVNQMLMAQCPTLSEGFITLPALKPLLSDRPLDMTAVCACTEKGFAGDKRLQEQLTADDATLNVRMSNPRLVAYMSGRLMASIMSCMAPEMEATLKASSPE